MTTQSVSRRDHRFPGQEPRGGLHCTVTGLSAGVQAPWRWSRRCRKCYRQGRCFSNLSSEESDGLPRAPQLMEHKKPHDYVSVTQTRL